MRIALFSSPRTLSSYTIDNIARLLKLTNYEELYNSIPDEYNEEIIQVIEDKLYNQDDYVVKIMAGQARNNKNITFNDIRWDIFDKIVCTERESIADQVCSFYFGTIDEKPMTMTTPIHIETSENSGFNIFVSNALRIINYYNEYKLNLVQRYPEKIVTISHDMMVGDGEAYVTEFNKIANTNFPREQFGMLVRHKPYRQLIINYGEVEEIINRINVNNTI